MLTTIGKCWLTTSSPDSYHNTHLGGFGCRGGSLSFFYRGRAASLESLPRKKGRAIGFGMVKPFDSAGLCRPRRNPLTLPFRPLNTKTLDHPAQAGELHFEIQSTTGTLIEGNEMKVTTVGVYLVLFAALAGCVTVNDRTVKDMPTGYLCQFLDPNTWLSTAAERQAIFDELKLRNADCILPSGTSKPAF